MPSVGMGLESRTPAVQIFAVTIRWPGCTQQTLAGAVQTAGAAFPQLDPGTLIQEQHSAHRICLAAISHGREIAAPRTYRARRDGITVMYDGRPVDRQGEFEAHDASSLLQRWTDLPGRLEGVFSAVRVDGNGGRVECLLDVLGLAQVYVARARDGWSLSNSVEVLRLLTGFDQPDALGVSSLLTLGWPAGDHTLLAGIEVLPGGHLHRFGRRADAHPVLTAATVVPRDLPPDESIEDFATAMTRTMRASAAGIGTVRCALTGGRDSRVVLALALAAEVPVELFTSGHADDLDVQIARDLAVRLGLAHETITPRLSDDAGDRADQTARFVTQTGGLASLWDVADWIEHQEPAQRLALKLWGAGGEIGRAGNLAIGIPFMANAPLLRRSWRAQHLVLDQRVDLFDGLITAAAEEETLRYLLSFIAQRRYEGWRPAEVLESYYAFERVKHWAAAGVRRAAEGTDVFTPFVTRDFITYCFSLTPGRRYMEAAHHRLLSVLSPTLRDLPFEHPWRPQRARAAAGHVTVEAARWATGRIARQGRPRSGVRPCVPERWVESAMPLHREMSLSFGDSPLWELVDRRKWESLLAMTSQDRRNHAEGVSRVLTAFWYLHGRHGSGGARPSVPLSP